VRGPAPTVMRHWDKARLIGALLAWDQPLDIRRAHGKET